MNCNGGLFTGGEYEKIAVPLKSIDVSCDIQNLVASVTSKLTYVNKEDKNIEAVFIFPLDERSAVFHFEAEVEGRRIVAEVQEKQEAKETYERAVDEGHTAFLLEEDPSMGDTFKCSVGNINAKATVVVTLKYITELTKQAAEMTDGSGPSPLVLTLPSVLNPRYNPNRDGRQVDRDNFNEEITYTSSKTPYSFNFEASVRGSSAILSVESAKDKFDLDFTSQDKTAAKVKLNSKFLHDHDLELLIKFAKPHEPHVSYERAAASGKGFFELDVAMLNFLPDMSTAEADDEQDKNEFIFLVDRSGSMSGSNIKAASETLLLFLKSLPLGCRFNIVGFGSRFESLFPSVVKFDKSNLKRALDYQKALKADYGGTEVLSPLKSIYSQPPPEGYIRHVFFLTDGDVCNTDEVVSLVSRHVTTTRMFAVGIGEGASTALVSGVARAGGGRAEFVRSTDSLLAKVMGLLQSAVQPRVSDMNLKWSLPAGVHAVTVPTKLPSIFCGHYLTVFALLSGDLNKLEPENPPSSVILSGKLGSKDFSLSLSLTRNFDAENSDFPVRRLAAKYQIREMTDASEEEDKLDKKGIITLSTQANIISKFTAFVGVDPLKKDVEPAVLRPVPRQHMYDTSFQQLKSCAPLMSCGLAGGESYKCRSTVDSMPKMRKKSKGFSLPHFSLPNVFARRSRSMKSGKATSMKCAGAQSSSFDCEVDSFEARSSPNAEKKPVVVLAELQDFDGFWELKKALTSVVGLDMDRLVKAKPVGIDDNVWATALVIAYLASKCTSEQTEWHMMVQKAKTWMKKQLKSAGEVDKALAEAGKLF